MAAFHVVVAVMHIAMNMDIVVAVVAVAGKPYYMT